MKNKFCLIAFLVFAVCHEVSANNITVTNLNMGTMNTSDKYMYVSFQIKWDNSWRTDENWDAAWVFVKFKPEGSNNWQHAILSTVSSDHIAPTGSTADAVSDGMGVFIRRGSNGNGNLPLAYAKLKWNYGANGCNFARGQKVYISVHAIEMVYIPEGSFYLGSTGAEQGHFYRYTDGSQHTNAYMVLSEDAFSVGSSSGKLYYANESGSSGDQTGVISNAFPKGYKAFYCMKYEISQGQYADFLNKLTGPQWTNRFANANGSERHTISGSCTNVTASVPERACNYLCWMDGCAYAAWAGLRPMTELEYEKACRGPALPVANEYAWGNIIITQQVGHVGIDGSGTETPSPATANCLYNNGIQGPVRCGIFARPTSLRSDAGATYYGVMEMSASVIERIVTIGNSKGRGFQGTHGNGQLSSDGYATNSDWPGYSSGKVTGADGAGYRGGCWSHPIIYLTVSQRQSATYIYTLPRGGVDGWRGVRTAP